MNKPGKLVEPLVGFLVDVTNAARGRVRNPHSLMKLALLNELRERSHSTELIEVGTFLGVTAARSAKHFEKVFTIELSQELFEKAKSFLASYPNVTVLQGDGCDHIKKIFENKSVKCATIFLDGHFSGGITAHGEVPEPAIEELKLLSKFKDQIGAIMIDDFRSFGEEPGFPTKSELIDAVEKFFPGYQISIQFDQVLICRQDAK